MTQEILAGETNLKVKETKKKVVRVDSLVTRSQFVRKGANGVFDSLLGARLARGNSGKP